MSGFLELVEREGGGVFLSRNAEQAALTMDKALEAAQDSGDQVMETQLLCEASDMSLKGGNVERLAKQ